MAGSSHSANSPPGGDIPIFAPWATDAAFRFCVSQGDKMHARDDIRRNMANLSTSVMTPIALPTWGRIARMAKRAHNSGFDWAFVKRGRASAYKQLHIRPRYDNLTVVSLRNPSSGKWMAFIPRVLLCGDVSAVIRYNCFFRALAVLINK